MVLCLNVCDKEHLALRNNFRVTKKFLITKFDCILRIRGAPVCQKLGMILEKISGLSQKKLFVKDLLKLDIYSQTWQ